MPPGAQPACGRGASSRQASSSFEHDSLPADLKQGDAPWLLDRDSSFSPASHGSSSESLSGGLDPLHYRRSTADAPAAAAAPACSCAAVVPQLQQLEPPATVGHATAAPLDWQALLEDWAVPASAAVPPLDVLLAEDDELPPLPLQPLQQKQRHAPASELATAAPQSACLPAELSGAGGQPGATPPGADASAAARPPPANKLPREAAARRPRTLCSRQPKSGGAPASVTALLAQPPQPISAAASMPALPLAAPRALGVAAASGGARKRGRPRLYDTLTPVLEAATIELQVPADSLQSDVLLATVCIGV